MRIKGKGLIIGAIIGLGAGVLIKKILSEKSLDDIKEETKENLSKVKEVVKENIDKVKENLGENRKENTSNVKINKYST
ncbi:MAG: YtxH domain-containing protein [Clostridium sp.]|uniref:YtxH-like protein n=1 Tax=Clostridium tertium TaxID=1559 RepID=A0A6N3FSZ9_9CLOT|nr:YtxH domain-containing protein [Clostridium sp.]MDU3546410.1 YtxH domain-containing protein [Clostridium sp.]